MRRRARFVLAGLAAALVPHGTASADSAATVRARQATTLVELFLEPDELRVELEIGAEDRPAFEVLLEVNGNPAPLRDWFLRRGLRISADDEPLIGQVEEVTTRARLPCDAVTGEPRADLAHEARTVDLVRLRYALSSPRRLTLAPPTTETGAPAADPGFVLYDRGVAVNDARLLTGPATLTVDPQEPWNSRFDDPRLGRQFGVLPVVFLSIEAHQVAVEVLARWRDLEPALDRSAEGEVGAGRVLAAADQEALREQVAALLASRNPLRVDGERTAVLLDRVQFLEPTLRRTEVIEPPRDLPAAVAMIGVVLVYPRSTPPTELSFEWTLFADPIEQVSATVTDDAGSRSTLLVPGQSQVNWRRRTPLDPAAGGLAQLPVPRDTGVLAVPLWSILAVLVGLVVLLVRRRRGVAPAGLAVIAAALLASLRVPVPDPLDRSPSLSAAEAREVTDALLKNVYHAFDFRDEEAIYDTLAGSAAGDLLTDVYLQTRRSLHTEELGGAQVRVQTVELTDCVIEPAEGRAFTARCRWIVTGSVGHWGHVHQRRNQYQAEFRVDVVDGAWKLVSLDVQDERRL